MNIRDFRMNFEGVNICKYHHNYKYDSIRVDVNDQIKIVRLYNLTDSHIYLSAN